MSALRCRIGTLRTPFAVYSGAWCRELLGAGLGLRCCNGLVAGNSPLQRRQPQRQANADQPARSGLSVILEGLDGIVFDKRVGGDGESKKANTSRMTEEDR